MTFTVLRLGCWFRASGLGVYGFRVLGFWGFGVRVSCLGCVGLESRVLRFWGYVQVVSGDQFHSLAMHHPLAPKPP